MAGGRKNKYQTHVEPKLLLIEAWARDGLTIDQIAEKLGVANSTFFDYKNKHSELLEALKRGQEVADVEVENALFKRALGYDYEENTYISVEMSQEEYDLRVEIELAIWDRMHPKATQDERDRFILTIPKTKEVLEKKVTKQVSPDTTAQIFWLKNRRPSRWRDKQEIGHSGSVDVNNPYKDLTTDELRKLIRDG